MGWNYRYDLAIRIEIKPIHAYFPMETCCIPHPDPIWIIKPMIDNIPFVGSGHLQDRVMTSTIDSFRRIFLQDQIVLRHLDWPIGRG
ncbi:hypothetical protein D3C81_960050 [compost metagenome]